MDYEKKYKEALERARMYRDNAKAVEEYAAVARYENIFPELRESEDERIRQFLIERIISLYGADSVTPEGIAVNDIVSYLEKQKEPKLAPDDLQKSFEAGQTSIIDNPEQYGLCKATEWSEEEIGYLYTLARYIKSKGYEDDGDFLEEVANKLKCLCPSWKPSEEQI